MSIKRIYIITESHEIPPQEQYTNLIKLHEELQDEYDLPSLNALHKRLQRAKKRTGKSLIRLKDKSGKEVTIEIRDVK